MLFQDAPKSLIKKIEQVVRLILSKGVGIYFVTQNLIDIPESILGQLGNRIQHALRAFTPRDQKVVKAAAQTFHANPKLNVIEEITQLGVGKALVSVLDKEGAPTIVEKTKIRPPESRMGPAKSAERKQVISLSPVLDEYDTRVDRNSAFELLAARSEKNVAKDHASEKQRKYKNHPPKNDLPEAVVIQQLIQSFVASLKLSPLE